ncbi:hypothetical protein ACJROX_29600 [Pseudalkalibacillus sp. A8]|uniref:hypothetical protein n=1 Tax=Pseudalkalibacillus sp. A8 TaxID=3382641 RepID=UPI0038B44F27
MDAPKRRGALAPSELVNRASEIQNGGKISPRHLQPEWMKNPIIGAARLILITFPMASPSTLLLASFC